jgi:hypothetical protein
MTEDKKNGPPPLQIPFIKPYKPTSIFKALTPKGWNPTSPLQTLNISWNNNHPPPPPPPPQAMEN